MRQISDDLPLCLESNRLYLEDRSVIVLRIQALQYETVRSSWAVREIDKITALGYFIIVISTFIFALFVDANFAYNFLKGLQQSPTVAGYQIASLAGDNHIAAGDIITLRYMIGFGSSIGVGAVDCSQGGGDTTTQSSSSSMTGTTQDGDGDGILDANDNCPNLPHTSCFIEGNTAAINLMDFP